MIAPFKINKSSTDQTPLFADVRTTLVPTAVLLCCCSTHWLRCLVVRWVIGWLVAGWVRGWRLFRAWVGAFVAVEGGAVIFFGTTLIQQQHFVLSSIHPACSGEVRARNNASVCCCTAVAWWVGWLVGGRLGRWVGVSSGTWVGFRRRTGSGCRVGAVVVLCVASFPCCRTLMRCCGFVLFEK